MSICSLDSLVILAAVAINTHFAEISFTRFVADIIIFGFYIDNDICVY